IDTRLRKRGERGLDAVVLAACGLDRLGLGAEIGRGVFPGALPPQARPGPRGPPGGEGGEELRPPRGPPAAGGGGGGAEARGAAAVGGGCLAPLAAHHDGERLTALVAAEDGSWLRRISGGDPDALGRELASLAGAS